MSHPPKRGADSLPETPAPPTPHISLWPLTASKVQSVVVIDFRSLPEDWLIEQLLEDPHFKESVLVAALQTQRQLIEQGLDVHLGEVLLREKRISEAQLLALQERRQTDAPEPGSTPSPS